MDNAEITERARKKRFLIDAFLHTSSHAGGKRPNEALKNAVTAYFLKAVILELIVKILYELDTKTEAPFTHNLAKLFGNLNLDTQKEVTDRFNEARERQKMHTQYLGIDNLAFHPLENVLEDNETTIKNFKYDATGVKSNSSADSIFYRDIFVYLDKRVAEMNA